MTRTTSLFFPTELLAWSGVWPSSPLASRLVTSPSFRCVVYLYNGTIIKSFLGSSALTFLLALRSRSLALRWLPRRPHPSIISTSTSQLRSARFLYLVSQRPVSPLQHRTRWIVSYCSHRGGFLQHRLRRMGHNGELSHGLVEKGTRVSCLVWAVTLRASVTC